MGIAANQQNISLRTAIPLDSNLRKKDRPFLRIEPSAGWASFKVRELWDYRELFYFLAWRDIKLRYKQTELGIAWAILQPLLTMLIFSLFFGKLARIPSDGVPYPVFAFTALVPWVFFANGLSQASNSLVGNSNLITKVYFPRLMIPTAAVFSGVFDFALSFIVLLGMLFYYEIPFTEAIFCLPLFLLLALITSMGMGLWFSALNVKYRDVRFVVPFLVQIWMFATPIAYPSSLIPGRWRLLYGLNPMVGVIEGFRWMLLGAGTEPGTVILVSTAIGVAILAGGVIYFKQVERSFADVV